MRELIRYQIEARHPVTGFWEVKRECRCEYEQEDYMGGFFPFKRLKSRIVNKHEAELQCRKEVMMCRLAYEKEHEDVRVTIWEYIGGYPCKDVVWENGVWKDC